MGFSLEYFFKELLDALGESIPDQEKLDLLEAIITDGKDYAKDCNMINKGEK